MHCSGISRLLILSISVIATFPNPNLSAQSLDSLETELSDATGRPRFEILAALAEAYTRRDPHRAVAFSREALALLQDLGSGEPSAEIDIRYTKGQSHLSLAEYDSALAQADRILELSERRNDEDGLARAANLKATALAMQGRFTEAVPLFEEARKRWRSAGRLAGVANALNNLGIAHMRLGEYDRSLDYYFRALGTWEELGDKDGIARTLTNAGNVHYDLGNLDEAESLYIKVLEYHEKSGDERGQAIVLNNLGLIYQDRGEFARAVDTFVRGEQLASAVGDRSNLARLLGNEGKSLAEMERYEEALEKESRALALRTEIGDRRGMGLTEAAIGRIHHLMGNHREALTHFDTALAMADDVNDPRLKQDVYASTSEAYAAVGDFESALEAHRLFKATHDSLFNAESQETIAELRTRYETEQKEREIEALQYEQERASMWRNVLIVGLVLASLLVFLLYSRYRIRIRAHRQLEAAHNELKTTQDQLIQSEKAASLGRLTAGIAHEMKNPLNFVNNFATLSVELAEELRSELDTENPDPAEIRAIVENLVGNSTRIAEQGKKADQIVSSMMLHAAGSKGRKEPTRLNELVSDYVGITHHGMLARHPNFVCSIEEKYDPDLPEVTIDANEIGRVLANILYNAFESVFERSAGSGPDYRPKIRVSSSRDGQMAVVRISDNGIGLPDGDVSQVFDPFFTTKPTGTGTGLGLSISHDIVAGGHQGTLTAERTSEGAAFVIRLPL